jgi:VWFA-related protein
MRCALAAAALAWLAAQIPAAQVLRPAVVHIDAAAFDARDRVVESLQPADFELTENGAAQTLDSVRFVRVDPRPAPGEEFPPIRSEFDEQEQALRPSTRLFAIFLDEYHVSPGAPTARVRDTLGTFVDRLIGPRDLVVVLKPLDSLLTIRLTRDRESLRHAIDTFQGRRGDYAPRTPFERNYIAGDPARIEQVRAQVAASALNALVVHLGMLNDGRKTLLYVSEGMTRPARRRGLEALPSLDTVIRSASRYTVSIYPMDPRDAADAAADAAGRPAAADALQTLGASTDGRAIAAGAADDALRAMVDDASAYYVLTYRSAHADDGVFRDVRVQTKRPGLRVRARKGYWALWPDEALASEMLARSLAPAPKAPPVFDVPWHISPLIRSWFGVQRGDNGRTRVTFVWDPAPRVPGDRTRFGSPARIALKVLGADGATLFDGSVLPSTGSCGDGPRACDEMRAAFDAPPGRLRLRMSIEDAAGQPIDTDVREISIRDLKGPVALSTAEILRTRNEREFRVADADPDSVPVAAREFSRTERLLVRVRAYAPGALPRVSAKLLNRMGQTMRELRVVAPAAAGGAFHCDLPLAALAPGEYHLELSATGPAGEAKDLIGFRVTN